MHDLQSIIPSVIIPKIARTAILESELAKEMDAEAILEFPLACPQCFIEFPKDRRTQNDAPRHHARRTPKLAVVCRIHEFLQKSTQHVTKKLTKKREISVFWYPKVFIGNYCKMLPEIKISERILHAVKMYF